MCSIFLIKPKH